MGVNIIYHSIIPLSFLMQRKLVEAQRDFPLLRGDVGSGIIIVIEKGTHVT